MTKFLILVLALLPALAAFSQSPQPSPAKQDSIWQDSIKALKPVKKTGPSPETIARRKKMDQIFAKYSRDHIVLDLNGTNWIYNPNQTQMDGMRSKWFSRGLNIYFNWDFRIKGSRVSIAPGIGYSCSNIYSRHLLLEDSTGAHFTPINYGADTTAKINKLVLQYLDIPLELRIRTNPDKFGQCWKVAVGFKAGVRVDVHTKERLIADGDTHVYLIRDYPDFNQFHMGPTLRVGYSFFNITGYYGVLNVFKQGLGPKANEFSLGISFMAL
jgi:hypothetical protein